MIFFLDDDVRPNSAWLAEISAPLLTRLFDVCVGAVRIAEHLRRPWMTLQHRTLLASTESISGENLSFATGANFGFSRLVLQTVPRFDPELGAGRLGFWDDCLFSLQLKRAGYRFTMCPSAVVDHHFLEERLTRKSFLSRSEAEGRSRAYIAWHWEHCSQIERSKIFALRKKCRLSFLRFLRRQECHRAEGIAEWEINLAIQVGYFDQLSIEQTRPRGYEKMGLRKLSSIHDKF